MNPVILEMSISLDGYLSAANPTPEAALGVGGERLHEWCYSEGAPAMSLVRVHSFSISLDGLGTGEGESHDAHLVDESHHLR